MLPFNAVSGIGDTAAESLAEAYKEKAFHSVVADQLIEFAQEFAKFPKGVASIEDFYEREHKKQENGQE